MLVLVINIGLLLLECDKDVSRVQKMSLAIAEGMMSLLLGEGGGGMVWLYTHFSKCTFIVHCMS